MNNSVLVGTTLREPAMFTGLVTNHVAHLLLLVLIKIYEELGW